jgi:coproporphyrinogen III oxidase
VVSFERGLEYSGAVIRGAVPQSSKGTRMRKECVQVVRGLQDRITARLEALDGTPFREDVWEREGGGGGRTRVLEGGQIFEKAGVNFSEVFGTLSEEFATQLPGEGLDFSATGISLVLHPRNPMVPTVHANFRYVEKGDRAWFGGGADLTPYYLFEEDAVHFHSTWKQACDRHDKAYYPRFKQWCDEYFFLKHRSEARGVGGIFFDYLDDTERAFPFWKDIGEAFLDAYVPIVDRRRDEAFGEREQRFQLVRRGRYVEFNLCYDRGTVFGLKTGGRIESILMSLPPIVHYPYDFKVEPNSREEKLLDVVRQPRDWL